MPVPATILDTKIPVKDGDVVAILWRPYTLGWPSLVADLDGVGTFGEFLQRVHEAVAKTPLSRDLSQPVYAQIGAFHLASDRKRLISEFESNRCVVADLIPSIKGTTQSFAGQLERTTAGVWSFVTI